MCCNYKETDCFWSKRATEKSLLQRPWQCSPSTRFAVPKSWTRTELRACDVAGASNLRVDLHGGDVGLPVHVSDHPNVHVAVLELHPQLGSPRHRGGNVDHVGVGDDHPRVVDDQTGAAGQDHVLAECRSCGNIYLFFYKVELGSVVILHPQVLCIHLKITSMWTTAGAIFSTTSAMKLQV